jgi:hypothetical protein
MNISEKKINGIVEIPEITVSRTEKRVVKIKMKMSFIKKRKGC